MDEKQGLQIPVLFITCWTEGHALQIMVPFNNIIIHVWNQMLKVIYYCLGACVGVGLLLQVLFEDYIVFSFLQAFSPCGKGYWETECL